MRFVRVGANSTSVKSRITVSKEEAEVEVRKKGRSCGGELKWFSGELLA